ncbi:protein O-mannosyl-transferase 2-like [Homarus americanus]|uniref:protein O-mannosyl-transferase 2-like n=1 Tax=Homarus americanus TaxID=6706 RepID=UPI001C4623F8|nr:protein O-mannosyl-transferase 2-like [Homarus americanus]
MSCKEQIHNIEENTTDETLIKKWKTNKRRWRLTSEERWWVCYITLTMLALTTRQASLDQPSGTLWDEVHFGTFANHYINRTFYHDVHPPLGKMVIAGAAWLSGYNGSFEFTQGKRYTPDINYVAMRSMMAVLGSSLVPLSFLLVWELSASLGASSLAALCILTDTFIHRLNTLILLDPPLLASILASVYCITKFHNQRHRAWGWAWWAWLCLTGVCLGTVMSVKYVGVFTVGFVGCHTVYQLCCLAGDPHTPLWKVLPHTGARAVALIILPTLVYISSFVVHFWILKSWNPNAGGFYHTKFFAAFDNTEYDNLTLPEYVQYGANLTIQSSRPICGFLESWFDLFPSEWTAPCQQVTTSTLRDHEALSWIIKKVDLDAGAVIDGKDPQQEVVLVRNGDYVMLTHAETGRSLRSHGHRAPITKRHFQVCGYGDDGAGGPFETWQLLIPGEEVGVPLTTISHDFLLKHYKMNCYLKANEKVKLPPWAFKGAKEVTCTKNREQPGIEWHINWNVSPMVNKTISVRDKTVGLWGKIFFQHLNMFIGNAVLITGDDNDRNARPWMWPTNWQIQLLGSFPENKTAEGGGEDVYAVGMTNPLLTYLNLMGLGGVLVLSLAHSYCKSRCPHQDPALVEARGRTLVTCWWLLLCWAIHYLPFFFMSRVLYYHHYCPSYLFSCMITGVLLSWICETLSRKVRDDLREEFLGALLLVPVSALLASYIYFWPLATYMRGEIFEANPRLNPGLDFFYLGQLWPEFGYRKSEFQTISTTLVDRWLKDHLHNPDINATLYYTTPLDNTASHPSALQPVPASNYSLWTPGAVDPVGIL